MPTKIAYNYPENPRETELRVNNLPASYARRMMRELMGILDLTPIKTIFLNELQNTHFENTATHFPPGYVGHSDVTPPPNVNVLYAM